MTASGPNTPRGDLDPSLAERAACTVCGGTDARVLRQARYPQGLSADELRAFYRSSSDQQLCDPVVQCRGCGLVYLSPRPRAEIILAGYQDAVDPTFFAQNTMRIRTFKATLQDLGKRFDLQRGDKVLDVGCAGGAFPKAAADLGYEVIGIEPARWLVEEGKRKYGLDLRQGTLQDQKLPDGQFRLITLWDVIEHLTEPREVLAEIRRLLRADGVLVLNFPDYASVARRAMGEKWPFFLSVHLWYFTAATLGRLLREAGFEVADVRPYWQTLELGYVLHRASALVPPLALAERAVRTVQLGGVPLRYQMGQTRLVARLSR